MKNLIISYINSILVVCCLFLTSCDFDNILKDDNGNDMNLLLVDLPEFDAEYSFTFKNAFTGEIYESPADIKISGDSKDDIVSDLGYRKNNMFTSSDGELFLYLNPNLKVESSEVKFDISGNDNNVLVLPYTVSKTKKGRNNVTIGVIPASLLNYKSTKAVSSSTSDDNGILSGVTVKDSKDVIYDIVYLNDLITDGEDGVYAGFVRIGDLNIDDMHIDSNNDNYEYSLVYLAKDVYLIKAVSANQKTCIVNVSLKGDGVVTFYTKASNSFYSDYIQTTVSLPYSFSFRDFISNDNTISVRTKIDALNFDETKTLASDGGNVEFNVPNADKSGKKRYEIHLNAYSPDEKRIAASITKSFKYIEKENNGLSIDNWSEGKLEKGVVTLWLKENVEYTFRVNLNNKAYKYDITTNINEINSLVEKEEDITSFTWSALNDGYRFDIDVTNEEIEDFL
ncbi:MAG: hypothetical protein Q4F97_08775 [Bacteroidales bacterium]|nr:hypothetical protein [Bacteroidales bacterium]